VVGGTIEPEVGTNGVSPRIIGGWRSTTFAAIHGGVGSCCSTQNFAHFLYEPSLGSLALFLLFIALEIAIPPYFSSRNG
jgi:hypothetical protein